MGSTRRRTVYAAGLAGVLLLVGCDGPAGEDAESAPEKSRPAAVSAVTAAAERTSEASSAKVTTTVKSPNGLVGDVRLSGVMGWGPLVADLEVDTGEAASSLLPASGRLVWVEDTLYLGSQDKGATAPGGKEWMKLDFGDALAEAGAKDLAGGLGEVNNQDPSRIMALLRAAPNVRHVGRERVDGATAEHYRGTVTPAEAVEAGGGLDSLSEAERSALLKDLRDSEVKSYTIEAWVKDDLPLRINTTVDSPAGKISVVQKLSDYGVEVNAKAPPAADTFDVAPLLERFADLGA
ncbi:hypothetical protein MTQ01_05255 [Streptomyces sp. XM4193]|uniref:hypothetical protein n=1 Tax=Streptomyces sp. XM4193 TaxID=2929782 RepID=UPI001FFB4863|nr:hypothetical protein [Streptomyces sp. XM4193]MCK1795422.1 hypothetical protein [Streptomyces sp. XM4193]